MSKPQIYRIHVFIDFLYLGNSGGRFNSKKWASSPGLVILSFSFITIIGKNGLLVTGEAFEFGK